MRERDGGERYFNINFILSSNFVFTPTMLNQVIAAFADVFFGDRYTFHFDFFLESRCFLDFCRRKKGEEEEGKRREMEERR